MASFTKSLRNPSYLQSSFGIFMFFCAWGIWWSFFQMFLKRYVGLNSVEIGTVYSINSLATLILMFLYGMLQDKLGIRRHLAIVVSAIAVFVGPFVQFVYAPLLKSNLLVAAVLGSIVLSAGFMSACSLLEAVTERYSRNFGFEYGQSRAWGSFGYAIAALAAGLIFNVNPLLNFWCGTVIAAVMLAIYAFWRPKEQVELIAAQKQREDAGKVDLETTAPSLREMVSVLKMPTLWFLIVFMIFSNTFYVVFDQQMFPDYYARLFSSPEVGQATYGVLNSIQVFFESIMMGVVPIIMRKVGVRNALLLGAVVMFLRIGLCGVLHDPVTVSFVKMFHAIEVPLFCLPAFRYFTLHFDPRLSATLYMVGFQIASQIGQVVMSTPLGWVHDQLGDEKTFLLISVCVLLAVIYGYFILKRDNQEVGGDPFFLDKQVRLFKKQGINPDVAAQLHKDHVAEGGNENLDLDELTAQAAGLNVTRAPQKGNL